MLISMTFRLSILICSVHFADFDLIERKRRKVIPDYLDHIGGNNTQGMIACYFSILM